MSFVVLKYIQKDVYQENFRTTDSFKEQQNL